LPLEIITDEGGQIVVRAAEAVAEPGTNARPARLLKACLNKSDRGIVIDCLRVDRFDDTNVIRDAADVRQ
jgi:hypothetical protein